MCEKSTNLRVNSILLFYDMQFLDATTRQFVIELTEFTRTFSYAIEQAAQHIYLSAIPLTPKDSILHKLCVDAELPRVIRPLDH